MGDNPALKANGVEDSALKVTSKDNGKAKSGIYLSPCLLSLLFWVMETPVDGPM